MGNSRVAFFHDPALRYPEGGAWESPGIREAFLALLDNLGLDAHSGNPFADLAAPGDTVVVKPNTVTIKDHHFELNTQRQTCVTTHLSVLAPAVEWACRAVGPRGRVVIADSPIEASDFDAAMRKLGILRLAEDFRKRGMPVEVLDLRHFRVVPRPLVNNWRLGTRSLNLGLFLNRKLPGDPLGYATVDLGERSAFAGYPKMDRLRFYKPHFKDPVKAHSGGRHLLSTGKTVLSAKLIVNLPKMKTHKISGVTLSMKNHVGLLNWKTWLPHYTEGYPPHGDQFDRRPTVGERVQNFLRVVPIGFGCSAFVRYPKVDEELQQAKMPIYNGSWIGNDTLWRTVLDVARAIEYADAGGILRETPQRTVLSILDGVVAGEGNGPLGAIPKPCGVLMAGFDMASLDAVAVQMMGLDLSKVRYLSHVDPGAVEILGNHPSPPAFRFVPPERWEGLASAP
jgi:uncharacterized protein (DUF362 family)